MFVFIKKNLISELKKEFHYLCWSNFTQVQFEATIKMFYYIALLVSENILKNIYVVQVTLISHLKKCFEWLIRAKNTKYLKINNLYNTNRYGFWAEKFCFTQLFEQHDQILETLWTNKAINVLYKLRKSI